MDALAGPIFCHFDNFLLDLRVRILFRLNGERAAEPVPLGSRACDILCLLVEHHGAVVSRQTVIDRVWPNIAVEEHNLTVQMSALRRVLDEGRTRGSCIQTIPGRGYRFLPAVLKAESPQAGGVIPSNGQVGSENERADHADQPAELEPRAPLPLEVADTLAPVVRWRWQTAVVGIATMLCVTIGAFLGMQAWRGFAGSASFPRLSVVVLPFQNLSGNPAEDYLADGITDDLTTDLSHIPEAFVIARESAYTYKGKATDVRQIGRELGVRYVLEGSMCKLGNTLRVNSQLISSETGIQLWSDRFDQDIKDLADGQQHVVARMWGALGISMVDIERTRSLRERPTNPDAFDLILQARALRNQPDTSRSNIEALALYERALTLDPGSALAMAGVGYLLPLQRVTSPWWMDLEAMERAEKLIAQALLIAPLLEDALRSQMYLLLKQDRWKDAMAAADRFIEMFPNSPSGYFVLATCKTYTGNAEEEIPLLETAIRHNPRTPALYVIFFRMGFASLMAGRDADAIAFDERSLGLIPTANVMFRQNTMRQMASAYARMGQIDKSHETLAEANRSWPFDTVRSHWPEDPTSVVYAGQVRSYQEGLRRAGLRDHADEDADFGVASDGELHHEYFGLTPTTAPGARTIRTGDLVSFLAEREPIVIDPMTYFWGRSIPGAVGLKHAGAGGSLSGSGQDRLRRKMAELSGGDLSKPIVAVGWNSERFDGRNLALRLVAMGYTKVYWYRGGREAWEVAGLPEAELTVSNW